MAEKLNIFARGIRKLYRMMHKCKRYNHITISNAEVSSFLINLIQGEKPFCAVRFGNGEFLSMQYGYLLNESFSHRLNSFVRGYIDSYKPEELMGTTAIQTISFYSGFFPPKVELLDNFYKLMLRDLASVDLLGVVPWNKEDLFLDKYATNIEFCGYDRFEPYDYSNPWTMALKGKKVLVIHPFAKTIEMQYKRRKLLWKDPNVLPQFELKTLKAVQSLCGESTEYDTWFDALEAMERQIDTIDFDVAIIGCGAYGFPLAVYCKKIGKKAIQLAGATQILFGIKGKRWDEMPAVNKFYNDYWVYPLPEETPKNAHKVEGGCYW